MQPRKSDEGHGGRAGSPPAKKDPALLAYGIYGAVGFQLAATVVGGLLLGQWLDRKWGTLPWLTLAGMVVGMVGGFYNLIRITSWNQTRKEKRYGKNSS